MATLHLHAGEHSEVDLIRLVRLVELGDAEAAAIT
jgi:hypothetical protein